LHTLVTRFHERGVKVGWALNPWDMAVNRLFFISLS
jgi:hypothetical protein